MIYHLDPLMVFALQCYMNDLFRVWNVILGDNVVISVAPAFLFNTIFYRAQFDEIDLEKSTLSREPPEIGLRWFVAVL